MEDIGKRKNVHKEVKLARTSAKPKYCLLCGKEIVGICNSHSVPRMVLKTIAENGMLYNKNKIAEIEYFDCENGVQNTGTFQYICKECDGKEFADYENPDKILNKPTDLMMSEIAIKNLLLMISSRKYEREIINNKIQELHFVNTQQMLKVIELDIRDYLDDLELCLKIKRENLDYGFQIAYWDVLPYICPIAVQSTFTIYKDMKGELINHPYDLDEKKKNQTAHLCVFPFSGSTVVLLFYHKRDKSYKRLLHQINTSSKDEILKYINYLVFALADNFFFSKSISEEILNNDAFIRLSREYIEQPNYGFHSINKNDEKYLSNKPVSPNEIPMIFDEKYSIKNLD